MRVVVTGGAGFIGSHLVDYLMGQGYHVTVIDNLSSSTIRNIEHWIGHDSFRFVKSDLKEYTAKWVEALRDADAVFHYAANPEVRVSTINPRKHFDENILATFNVLEACRLNNVKYLVFASSSTVYGDATQIPTPEDHPLKPISIYGASKAACEILASTYARLYGLKVLILRYANIIGPRLKHGVIYDFIQKLKKNPYKLEILGDGTQKKSYLYITDAIDATLSTFNKLIKHDKHVLIYNVGNNDWVSVREIADIIVETMGLTNVEYIYKPITPDGRGWPGDVKLMLLDITRIVKDTGWKPKMASLQAVRETTKALVEELHNK